MTTSRRTASLSCVILCALLLTCAVAACNKPATSTPRLTQTPVSLPTATQPAVQPSATPGATAKASPSLTPTRPASPALVGTLALDAAALPGYAPQDIALLGERVYVCNRDSDNVSIVEGDKVVAVLAVGHSPSALAADPITQRVFVLNDADGTLSVIAGDTVVATWTPEYPPSTLAMVGEELWAGTQTGDRILVLSPKDGTLLAQVPLSSSSAVYTLVPHLASDRVYAATYGQVHAVAIRSLDEVAHGTLESYRTLGVSRDGRHLYVTAWDADLQQVALRVLDVDSLQVQQQIPLAGDGNDVLTAPTDGRIYLLGNSPGELIVIDPQSLALLERLTVGLDPIAGVLSADASRLYIANREGDNVVAVDTATLAVVATIPLTLRIDDLAVNPEGGQLYAAVGAANRVYVLDDAGASIGTWRVDGHPYRVLALPDGEQVAVLGQADGQLRLLDAGGQTTRSLSAGTSAEGLFVDTAQDKLYAGEIVVDLATLLTDTVRVSTVYTENAVAPVQVVRDTRRNILYAVASNGVPGSNGGNVVTRLEPADGEDSAAVPGRLSVVDLLYDADTDRFFATNARMGTYGLQVSAAEDCRELLYLSFDRYPVAMALNSATHHLWVVLQPSYFPGGGEDAQVVAYDTRSLGQVATFNLEDTLASIAVDPASQHVYLGSAALGAIYVLLDVPMPEPAAPTATQTPTPWPTATSTLQPTVSPTAAATTAATRVPTLMPTCVWGVESSLLAAYNALGGEATLGCAIDVATGGSWAVQHFDGGLMLWRGDAATIYVLRADGLYSSYADNWVEGMPDKSCEATPPEGRTMPQRGFGLVWCRQADVASILGWPVDAERSLSILSQPFVGGTLLLDDTGVTYWLRADGTWTSV